MHFGAAIVLNRMQGVFYFCFARGQGERSERRSDPATFAINPQSMDRIGVARAEAQADESHAF
jgi:hypothetical protein